MSKKSVLHIVEHLYLGGIERLLEQLSSKTGDKAKLYFFTYETDHLDGIGKQIKENGFSVFTYKKKAGRDWGVVKELVRIIKENKIEVIHTHDFGPMEYAVLLKFLVPKIRLIHTHHTIVSFVKNRKYLLFFQFASFFYYRIIAVSSFVKETILERCMVMKRSCFVVIPNGVDINYFKKSSLLNDKNRLNLVNISRISKEKNLDYLLNTCRLLKETGIPFIFHQAGSSSNPNTLAKIKNYLKIHHLEENVILHGFSVDAKVVLDLGDIFLSASTTEGHPVAVLEAMACEKICFCSDISPHREIGHDYIHLFDIEDEFSLLKRLTVLYLDIANQEELHRCKRAREAVVNNFSLDKMINNYVEQYN